MVTAAPALKIPTILGFTVCKRERRAIWLLLISMCSLSKPSDSLISSKPKKNKTSSAFFASSRASFSSARSSPPWRRKPLAMPTTSISGYSACSSAAISSFVVFTTEDPAPWYLGVKAKSPIMATLAPFFKGRVFSSFFKSTAVSKAAFLARL